MKLAGFSLPPLSLGTLVVASLIFAGFAVLVWRWRRRTFIDTASVADAYDRWTEDQLLERLWGEHVHLGHYGDRSGRRSSRDFRGAKRDFVHELVAWSGLEQLPRGSQILDVGCGIGGSARMLGRDYGFEVLGISISPAQISRARELSAADQPNRCRFAVMDALDLELPDESFDAVWSVEAGPHMPDKQRYADELLRILKPGGLLVVADWNRRDAADGAMGPLEKWVMRQLLDQWAHPEFASIPSLRRNLESSRWSGGMAVQTDDWTIPTLPSWVDSIAEGFRRPMAILGLGPGAVVKGLREAPTLLLMDWAFRHGLMRFGVFRGRKPRADQLASPSEATLVRG